MKQGHATVKNLARLLEKAAKKLNEGADATCSVAACLYKTNRDPSDEMFDRIFDSVQALASVSPDKKPDYERTARALIAKASLSIDVLATAQGPLRIFSEEE